LLWSTSITTRDWWAASGEAAVSDSLKSGGRWSLDHLYIDTTGVPTLVDVEERTVSDDRGAVKAEARLALRARRAKGERDTDQPEPDDDGDYDHPNDDGHQDRADHDDDHDHRSDIDDKHHGRRWA
jgi:hypothetical protein